MRAPLVLKYALGAKRISYGHMAENGIFSSVAPRGRGAGRAGRAGRAGLRSVPPALVPPVPPGRGAGRAMRHAQLIFQVLSTPFKSSIPPTNPFDTR